MKLDGLGKHVPISLKSDPSDIQGDKKIIFWVRSMDFVDSARSQQLSSKLDTLPSYAELRDRLEAADEWAVEKIDYFASFVNRLDNVDGKVGITDKDEIAAILRKLPQTMIGELSVAIADHKELLKLKNQSPCGSGSENTADSKKKRSALTRSTVESVSAQGESNNESAGSEPTDYTRSSLSLGESDQGPAPKAVALDLDTVQPVT